MTIKRIPRPLGLTHLSYQYNKTKDKATKKKLVTTILKAFISEALLIPETHTQGKWGKIHEKTGKLRPSTITKTSSPASNKKTISKKNKNVLTHTKKTVLRTIRFHELAGCLGWSIVRLEERIQKVLSQQGDRLVSQVGKINYEAIARVHQSRLFFRSLEGLEQASLWAEEIRHETRAGGYRASNIMATNSAMGIELQALKMASDQASKFLPKTGINYHKSQHIHLDPNGQPIPNGNSEKGPEMVNGSQFLTPSMAMKMLEEKGHNPIPSKENGLLEAIAIENGLFGPNLVSVSATMNDAQGRTSGFNPSDMIEKINHGNRRLKEYNIVDEAVDIEAEEIEIE